MNLRWYALELEMLFGNSCHLRNGSFDLHKVGAYLLKVMHYSFQDKKSADQDLSSIFFGFWISCSIAKLYDFHLYQFRKKTYCISTEGTITRGVVGLKLKHPPYSSQYCLYFFILGSGLYLKWIQILSPRWFLKFH